MIKDDLNQVAIELIKEFGSAGKFLKNDGGYDPITGETSTNITEVEVEFFIEPFGDKELIENRILLGDAKLYFFINEEPKSNWTFIDDDLVKWNIANSEITKYWVQGKTVCYLAHIRK